MHRIDSRSKVPDSSSYNDNMHAVSAGRDRLRTGSVRFSICKKTGNINRKSGVVQCVDEVQVVGCHPFPACIFRSNMILFIVQFIGILNGLSVVLTIKGLIISSTANKKIGAFH